MEYPIYYYQSTLYNFAPFMVSYEYLQETLEETKWATEEFNAVFEKNLKKLVGNSNIIQLPTLKNLYQQVILSMKNSLTRTSEIQSVLNKICADVSTNLSKLQRTYQEHLNQIRSRGEELNKTKSQIEEVQLKIGKVNQQIQLVKESETVSKFYKQNYKQIYTPQHQKAKSELESQLQVMNSKMEYHEENLEQQVSKSKRQCTILSNELEEIMINTAFVDFNMEKTGANQKSRRVSNSVMVSAAIEEECIKVQRAAFVHQSELEAKVEKLKEEIDALFDQLVYQQ